jgi:hypothetical protein
MASKLIFLALFAFWGCTSQKLALDPAAIIEPAASKVISGNNFEYSFQDLQTTANYLAVLSIKNTDAKLKHVKRTQILPCDPNPKLVDMWSMQIKILVDEQAESVKESFLNHKTLKTELQNCDKNCVCGDYANIIKMTRNDLLILGDLQKKHKTMTENQMFVCAKKLNTFCSSQLHSHLKSLN